MEAEATAKADAHRELRSLEPQITDLRQQLQTFRGKKERSILRAPVAGIINELNVSTIGEVIPPGKTLVAIVPEEPSRALTTVSTSCLITAHFATCSGIAS